MRQSEISSTSTVDKKRSESQHRPARQQLRLNVLTFETDLKPFDCGFFESIGPRLQDAPLQKLKTHQVPYSYFKKFAKENRRDYLFTDFTNRRDADLHLTVNPAEDRNFMRAWYTSRIARYFRSKGLMVNRNFVQDLEIWLKLSKQPDERLSRFDRIRLKPFISRYTEDKPELVISYQGTSEVLKINLENYPGPLDDVRWVINQRPERVRYDEVVAREGHNLRDYYPVINREIRQYLNLPNNHRFIRRKLELNSQKIRQFVKKYINTKGFRRATGFNKIQFFAPGSERVSRIDPEHYRMVFGNDQSGTDIYQSLKNHGPWRSARLRHPRLLLIAPAGEKQYIMQKMVHPLLEGAGHYPGLRKLTGLPMQLEQPPILYQNAADPLPEIRSELGKRSLSHDDKGLIGLYVSPYSKFEQDQQKFEIYYRIKEELLRFGMSSQVVDLNKIKGQQARNLTYWMPNLAVALLAKLGGVPWKIDVPPRNELVIGIGAYKPRWSAKRYVGSSFCFENTGLFRGFDCFTHDETRLLAGSIKKAVQRYIAEYGKVERVVIHYYKQMSRREQRPLWEMINSLQQDVPIYVLTINKTQSRDEIAIDLNQKHRMPLNGTYIDLQHGRYLLFNNSRYTEDQSNIKTFPFPLKLRLHRVEAGQNDTTSSEEPIAPDVVHELMEQVAQFSRIYWKSISAQPIPVTIKYPELLARFVPYFKQGTLPEFGKENLFFL